MFLLPEVTVQFLHLLPRDLTDRILRTFTVQGADVVDMHQGRMVQGGLVLHGFHQSQRVPIFHRDIFPVQGGLTDQDMDEDNGNLNMLIYATLLISESVFDMRKRQKDLIHKKNFLLDNLFCGDALPEKSIVEGQRTLKIGGVIQEGFFFRVYQCDRVGKKI